MHYAPPTPNQIQRPETTPAVQHCCQHAVDLYGVPANCTVLRPNHSLPVLRHHRDLACHPHHPAGCMETWLVTHHTPRSAAHHMVCSVPPHTPLPLHNACGALLPFPAIETAHRVRLANQPSPPGLAQTAVWARTARWNGDLVCRPLHST